MIDIGYAGALAGGVLTLLSPCSAVLLPAFFAYAFSSRTALLGRSLVFYAGLVTTLVPLGVAASSLGMLVTEHRGALVAGAAWVVIVLGAVQILGITIPLPGRTSSGGDATSIASVYLLGAVYGIAGVCSGPILGSVLAVAAVGSSPAYGGVLLAVYALGMVVPVLILALLWDRLDIGRRRWLRPREITVGPIRTTVVSVVAGAIFIALGLLLLATEGTANLGGVLTIDTQYEVENTLRSWTSSVPDIAVVLAILVVAGAILYGWQRRTRDRGKDDAEARR
ncbi:MAG: cytochrome c biogenesis CcdA family protein [Actinomycetia bacterium]|nr:cytochrome c biogenesis CcdA family protein [Actinomycetes bacterium]